MTTAYPIADRRKLDPTTKKGMFRKQSRHGGELLKPDAHHVLVYRVDGQFVLDSDRLRANDERVVNATHVSMVDVRRNAPVVVQFNIPSSDAAHFEVFVTFVCTVTDPVAVVRGGVNAQEVLWGHLKSHHKIFDLGLEHPLLEVNAVRRAVGAQVTAYVTIRPPTVLGMSVALASVEVGTPESLRKFHESHRGSDMEQRLAEQRQENEHRLKAGRTLNDHSLEGIQQDHEQELAAQVHSRDLDIAVTNERHRQLITRERAEFERREFELNMAAIGNDPRRAVMAAYAAGRIDAAALAEQLQSLDDHDREAQLRQRELERDDRRELMASAREDRQLDRDEQRQREERREADELRERNERRRIEDLEREDRLRKADQEREDKLRREKAQREDAMQHLQMKVDLLKQAAAHGHLNMVNLGLDRLYAEVVGIPQTEVEDRTTKSLPAADISTVEVEVEDNEDKKAQVREEDD